MAEGPKRNIWDLIGDVNASPSTDADCDRKGRVSADPIDFKTIKRENWKNSNSTWLKGFEKLKKRVERRPRSPSKDAPKDAERSDENPASLPSKQRRRASSPVLSMMSKKLKVEMMEMKGSLVSISGSPVFSKTKVQSAEESHLQNCLRPPVIVSRENSEITQRKELSNHKTVTSIPLFESLSNVCRLTSRSARESSSAAKPLSMSPEEDTCSKMNTCPTPEVELPNNSLVFYPPLPSPVEPEINQVVSNSSRVESRESQSVLKQGDCQQMLDIDPLLVEPDEGEIQLKPNYSPIMSKLSTQKLDDSQAVLKKNGCQIMLNYEPPLVESSEPNNIRIVSNCEPSPIDSIDRQAVLNEDSLIESPDKGQVVLACEPSDEERRLHSNTLNTDYSMFSSHGDDQQEVHDSATNNPSALSCENKDIIICNAGQEVESPHGNADSLDTRTCNNDDDDGFDANMKAIGDVGVSNSTVEFSSLSIACQPPSSQKDSTGAVVEHPVDSVIPIGNSFNVCQSQSEKVINYSVEPPRTESDDSSKCADHEGSGVEHDLNATELVTSVSSCSSLGFLENTELCSASKICEEAKHHEDLHCESTLLREPPSVGTEIDDSKSSGSGLSSTATSNDCALSSRITSELTHIMSETKSSLCSLVLVEHVNVSKCCVEPDKSSCALDSTRDSSDSSQGPRAVNTPDICSGECPFLLQPVQSKEFSEDCVLQQSPTPEVCKDKDASSTKESCVTTVMQSSMEPCQHSSQQSCIEDLPSLPHLSLSIQPCEYMSLTALREPSVGKDFRENSSFSLIASLSNETCQEDKVSLDVEELPPSFLENKTCVAESVQLSNCISSTNLNPNFSVLQRSISTETHSEISPDLIPICSRANESSDNCKFKSSSSPEQSAANNSNKAGLLEHFQQCKKMNDETHDLVNKSDNRLDGQYGVSITQDATPPMRSSSRPGTPSSVDLSSTRCRFLATNEDHCKPYTGETYAEEIGESNHYSLILNTLPNQTTDCDSIKLSSIESGLDTDESSDSLNLPTAEDLDLSCVVPFASLSCSIKEEDNINIGEDMSESVKGVSVDLEELAQHVDVEEEGESTPKPRSLVSSEVFEDGNLQSGRLLNGCWFTDAQIERVLHALLEPCSAQAMDDLARSLLQLPEAGSVEFNTDMSKIPESSSEGTCFSMNSNLLLEELIATEKGSPVPDIGLLSAVLEDNCVESGSQHSCCSSLDGFLRADNVESSSTKSVFTDHSLKSTDNSDDNMRLQVYVEGSEVVRTAFHPEGNLLAGVTQSKRTSYRSSQGDSDLSTRSPFGFTDAASITKLRDACSAVDATNLRSMQLEKRLRNFIYDTDYFKKRVEISLPRDCCGNSSPVETCQKLTSPIEGRCCCEGNKRQCRTLLRMPEKLLELRDSSLHNRPITPLFSLVRGNDSCVTNQKRKLHEEMMSTLGDKKNKVANTLSKESSLVLKAPGDIELIKSIECSAESSYGAKNVSLNVHCEKPLFVRKNKRGRFASRNTTKSEVNGYVSGSDELALTNRRRRRVAERETALSRSLDSSSAERLWESCTFNISNKAVTSDKESSVVRGTTSKQHRNLQRTKPQLDPTLKDGPKITDYFSRTLRNGVGVNGQSKSCQNTHKRNSESSSLSTDEIGTDEELIAQKTICGAAAMKKPNQGEDRSLRGHKPTSLSLSEPDDKEPFSKSRSLCREAVSISSSPLSQSFNGIDDLHNSSSSVEQNIKENKGSHDSDHSDEKNRASRKRCLLLKQLANSEGYVADKREMKLDNLLVDSTMLGREERALQMALIRIREMETLSLNKTSPESQKNRKSDNPLQKSTETKTGKNQKKLMVSRQQWKQKSKDFAPDRNRHLTRVYADKKIKAQRAQGLSSKANEGRGQKRSAGDVEGLRSRYQLRNHVKSGDFDTNSSKSTINGTGQTQRSFHGRAQSQSPRDCLHLDHGHQLSSSLMEFTELKSSEATRSDVVAVDLSSVRKCVVDDKSSSVEARESSCVVGDEDVKDCVRKRRFRSRWRRGYIRKNGRRRQAAFLKNPSFTSPSTMMDEVRSVNVECVRRNSVEARVSTEGRDDVEQSNYKCDPNLLTLKRSSDTKSVHDLTESAHLPLLPVHQGEPKGEDSSDSEVKIVRQTLKEEGNDIPGVLYDSRNGLLSSVTETPLVNDRQVPDHVATVLRRSSSSSTMSSDSTESRLRSQSKMLIASDDDCQPFSTDATDSGISIDSLLPTLSNIIPVGRNITPVINSSTECESSSYSLQDFIELNQLVVPAEVKKIAIDFSTGETVLHKAARLGYLTAALWCCKTGHVGVNARNNADYTPLHESCAHGHAPVAECLIFYGADINAISRLDGARPLHDAVESDSIDTVRLMLSAGADVSHTTYSSKNIFQLCRSVQMKNFLLAYLSDQKHSGTDWGFEESPWCFEPSWIAPSDILSNLPADCGDDAVMLESCDVMFPTAYHLHVVGSDEESAQYVLLADVVDRLGTTRRRLLSSHDDLQTYQLAWESFKLQTMLLDFKAIEQRLDRLDDPVVPLDDVTRCRHDNGRRVVEVVKLDGRLRRLFHIDLYDVERNRSRD